jgi:predicted RNase H-like nuclease
VTESAPAVAGLDGCRVGWVMVTVPTVTAGAPRVEVVTDLGLVTEQLERGLLAAAAIDIPIGLSPDRPRPVDREARRRLGARRSSVFPAPVRPVLAATSYAEACQVSRAASGRAISRQLFGILPKIREVDALQSPALQDGLFEMHPEVSFAELAGAPMQFHKSTRQGRAERLDALRRAFPELGAVEDERPRGTQPDDVLDAVVGAWTAQRFVAGRHLQLGGETDETGLRMEIIV